MVAELTSGALRGRRGIVVYGEEFRELAIRRRSSRSIA